MYFNTSLSNRVKFNNQKLNIICLSAHLVIRSWKECIMHYLVLTFKVKEKYHFVLRYFFLLLRAISILTTLKTLTETSKTSNQATIIFCMFFFHLFYNWSFYEVISNFSISNNVYSCLSRIDVFEHFSSLISLTSIFNYWEGNIFLCFLVRFAVLRTISLSCDHL